MSLLKHVDKELKIQLIFDFIHRITIHYGQWLAETKHQLGEEKSWDLLREVWEKSRDIQFNRLSKALTVDTPNMPFALNKMSHDQLDELLVALAKNWLANDGLWFQAVEFKYGLNDAKRCNDSCWAQFSPVEGWSIKQLLKLGDSPGLDGLRKSLDYRLYAVINEQEVVEHTENKLIFRMNKCRVQEARKRKGLADYPCKSAGIVEYQRFAEAIDNRIKTRCLGCPPDPHPENWYCSWEFVLEE